MHDDFIGTMPVPERHRFDVARLERYLREHVEGFSGTLEVEQFKGGQSNPTFMLKAGGKRYVLRRKPPGKLLPSAHAVDREYRVITALHGNGVPGGEDLLPVRRRHDHRHGVLCHGLRGRPGAVGAFTAGHEQGRSAAPISTNSIA